jgi:hypothetical protein
MDASNISNSFMQGFTAETSAIASMQIVQPNEKMPDNDHARLADMTLN